MSHLNGFTTASVEPTSSYLSSAVEVPYPGLIFVSGMCGQNEGKFIKGTVKDRTIQALRRVEALLREKGLDLTDVVACTIYLAHYVEDFAAFNEAYLSVFTGDVKPSRTCVGVSALPAGTDVEITAIALQRTGSPKRAISSKNAPPPAPFLSSAIGTDELVFLSGACGVKDGKFVEGTVADRTKVALGNIEALLKEEGLDLSDIVSTTVYLTDYDGVRPNMDPVWHSIMTSAGASLGVRTCIGVAELPAKTDCEFTCIAARRGKIAVPATPAGALYSEANRLDKAGLAFICGTTCSDLPKDAGVKAHTKAILELVRQRLARLNLDFSDLVAATIYLSNYKEDFAAMNEAYISVLKAPFPSRTCIGVKSLPDGTDVEITVTAALRLKSSKL